MDESKRKGRDADAAITSNYVAGAAVSTDPKEANDTPLQKDSKQGIVHCSHVI